MRLAEVSQISGFCKSTIRGYIQAGLMCGVTDRPQGKGRHRDFSILEVFYICLCAELAQVGVRAGAFSDILLSAKVEPGGIIRANLTDACSVEIDGKVIWRRIVDFDGKVN